MDTLTNLFERLHRVPPGLQALDATGGGDPIGRFDLDTDLQRRVRGAPIRCLACGQTVTHRNDSIEVGGAHVHRCVNPADVHYEIGCFRVAPGLIEAGNAIFRHSWFPGYGWRLGLCGDCGSHLGWAFCAQGVTYFFGLILKRLTAEH